jgi:hypothetical protein
VENNQNNQNQANDELRKALENFYYSTSTNNTLKNGNSNTANFSGYASNGQNQYAIANGQYALTGTSLSVASSSSAGSISGTYDNTITIADGQGFIDYGADT